MYLAESPKSIRVYEAYAKAKALVRDEQTYPVPIHLRNAPTKLMKDWNYGRDYKYEPSFQHPVYQPFLPPELEDKGDFLTADTEVAHRTWSEEYLREWEAMRNNGEPWKGRPP